jgi:DNA modification methylase
MFALPFKKAWGEMKGEGQIYCGDSKEVLKMLPANSVDAIITDPP